MAVHVGALTAAYAAMQFIFAPVWGRLSDRVGRRPLVLVGLAGFAASQVLFGLATTMWALYAARAVGGILSSALLPSASAYVADTTNDEERGRGMVWLNTAVALGTVIGPALSGVLTRRDVHVRLRGGHFLFDSFSVPFFAAAFLALVGFVAALVLLGESRPPRPPSKRVAADEHVARFSGMAILLGAATGGYLGITLFEATISLLMQQRFRYGPGDAGSVFVVCGIAMIVVQFVGIRLAKRIGEVWTVTIGFALMGLGMLVLAAGGAASLAFIAVSFIGAGMAFIVPGLSSLLSKKATTRAGAAMGLQSAAQSVGQVGGPVLGGVLFGWHFRAPYLLGGALMAGMALLLAMRLGRNQS